jgi:hypothetical protein
VPRAASNLSPSTVVFLIFFSLFPFHCTIVSPAEDAQIGQASLADATSACRLSLDDVSIGKTSYSISPFLRFSPRSPLYHSISPFNLAFHHRTSLHPRLPAARYRILRYDSSRLGPTLLRSRRGASLSLGFDEPLAWPRQRKATWATEAHPPSPLGYPGFASFNRFSIHQSSTDGFTRVDHPWNR